MSLYTKIIDLQKLGKAWEKVRRNKPAAGVDGVSAQQFNENSREELKKLNLELVTHQYHTMPVRKVVLYREDKAREIALFSMRDKVVQQSVIQELNKIYEPEFSSQTYAYRSNKSALKAVEEINQKIQEGGYEYILKVDIRHFFDTISWPILKRKLKRDIPEEDVLELIKQGCRTRILTDDGELVEPDLGIHQGSILSPVLSNIYMMEFDHWLLEHTPYFVRYSDDLLVLAPDKDTAGRLLLQIRNQLQILGLEINTMKSMAVPLETGTVFLGYQFSKDGKTVPAKARQSLQDRLEMMWLTSPELEFTDKIQKAGEIIGGWEQYFREERKISSIFEYVTVFYLGSGHKKALRKLRDDRKTLQNEYRDIADYLAQEWRRLEDPEMELLEYEQFFQVDEKHEPEKRSNDKKLEMELLENYRKHFASPSPETATELMQTNTDLGEYKIASVWMKERNRLEASLTLREKNVLAAPGSQASSAVVSGGGRSSVLPPGSRNSRDAISGNMEMSEDDAFPDDRIGERDLRRILVTAKKMLEKLAGREDVFSLETIDAAGHRKVELQTLPLTQEKIVQHLQGKCTVGTYIQRPNATVHTFIVDVDVSKKVLLQVGRGNEKFDAALKKALQTASDIQKCYESFGLKGYVEYSGCRGYHVWLLLTEWIPVRYANMFSEVLQQKGFVSDTEITIEFFPNKTRIRNGKFGQTIKLPYGIHAGSGERSYFLDEEYRPVTDIDEFLDGMSACTLSAVKRVLAANAGLKEKADKKTVDDNLEMYGDIPDNVRVVLSGCTLMRYLCQKAAAVGYLTHFERQSVLYVFGHLGDEGKEFVHTVMAKTLNYKYNVTERFIRKIPEKPVSCLKLREQYKQITAEIGCSCVFRQNKKCYPSPVLHALLRSGDDTGDITVPVSKTVSRESEKKIAEEINIHARAEEIAKKILTLKKQRRRLDASVIKEERRLEKLFDGENTDCLEIEMGMLVRRRKDDGYEWLIEI